MILFVVLSFVMVFILIWQQIQHKKLVREIDYITSRLDTISVISEKALSKAIIENGIGLESMGRKQDTLEDFFFQLTEEEK